MNDHIRKRRWCLLATERGRFLKFPIWLILLKYEFFASILMHQVLTMVYVGFPRWREKEAVATLEYHDYCMQR